MSSARLQDVTSLAVFARVVETKSFTAAAAALGITKAAVSQRITALEQQCAARLIERTTRRLWLTAEGEGLYRACAGLTVAADSAAAMLGRVGRVPQGVLRVTAPVAFGVSELIPVLPAFNARYPDVVLDLELTDRTVDLAAEGFDVAIRFARRLADSSLGSRRLATDRTLVCASPAYLAARGTPQEPEDLRRHACLCLTPVRAEWSFSVGGERVVVPVTGPLRCNDVRALRDAAVAGLGVAVLPQSLVEDDLAAARLAPVLQGFAPAVAALWALFPSRHVPVKSRVFVQHLVSALKTRGEARVHRETKR